MSPFLRWVVVIAAVVFGTSVVTLAYMAVSGKMWAKPAALAPNADVADLSLPNFELTDQLGRKQTEKLFEGEVTVLDFFFTNCPFACPKLTRAMWEMQRDLAGTRVRFASISVDPAHDTVAKIKEHATAVGVDPDRWLMLTGPIETVRDICVKRLKFNLADDESTPITLADGGTMHNISHPTRFILIGPDKRVLAIFGSDDEAIEACKQRAKAAAAGLR